MVTASGVRTPDVTCGTVRPRARLVDDQDVAVDPEGDQEQEGKEVKWCRQRGIRTRG